MVVLPRLQSQIDLIPRLQSQMAVLLRLQSQIDLIPRLQSQMAVLPRLQSQTKGGGDPLDFRLFCFFSLTLQYSACNMSS